MQHTVLSSTSALPTRRGGIVPLLPRPPPRITPVPTIQGLFSPARDATSASALAATAATVAIDPRTSTDDLRAKIEALRRQNEQLRALERRQQAMQAQLDNARASNSAASSSAAAARVSTAPPSAPPKEPSPRMDIVFVAAEVAPWSKTGGLGDVMAALPVALAKLGHRVMVVTPRYLLGKKCEEQYAAAGLKDTGVRKVLDMQRGQLHEVGFYHCHKDNVDWVFVDHISYHRQGTPYGGPDGKPYSDNLVRFALLCMAACEAPLVLNVGGYRHTGQPGKPYGQDVLFVANDWHTGLLPVYLASRFRPHGVYKQAKSVLTLHNIAHQGTFSPSEFHKLGLPDDWFKTLEWLEQGRSSHDRKATMNLLKAAIVSSDQLVTVSQRYAWDISHGMRQRAPEPPVSFEPEPEPSSTSAATSNTGGGGTGAGAGSSSDGARGASRAGGSYDIGSVSASMDGYYAGSGWAFSAANSLYGAAVGAAAGAGMLPLTSAGGATYFERLSRLVKRDLKEMSLVGCGGSGRAAVALDPSARAALRWNGSSGNGGASASLSAASAIAANNVVGLGAAAGAPWSGSGGGSGAGDDGFQSGASSSGSMGGFGAGPGRPMPTSGSNARVTVRGSAGKTLVTKSVDEDDGGKEAARKVIRKAERLRNKQVAALAAAAAGGAGTKAAPSPAGGKGGAGAAAAAAASAAAEVASGGGAVLGNLLRNRAAALRGIVNGVDTQEWDPSVDPHLPFKFNHLRLEAKTDCKLALQRELGLPLEPELPLLVFIGRLDYQKGPDLVLDALPRLISLGCQVVLLGSGAPDYQARLAAAQDEFPDYVRGIVGFDVPLSHRLLAAGDVLLMPSRFEPCGLNQMHAMRYGCVPVAHCTGGLSDTIDDVITFADTAPTPATATTTTPGGTGWTFSPASTDALVDAVSTAVQMYTQDKRSWQALQRRGMAKDFSWDRAAAQYESLFLGLMGKAAAGAGDGTQKLGQEQRAQYA